MPHPKVKLSDDSGNAVSVTGNRLDVNAYLAATPTIDIGDVSLLLGGTAASTNAGTMDAQTLRITIATDDTHFGAVGAAADNDGNIHGQLYYANNKLQTIDEDTGNISSNTNSLVSIITTLGSSTYTEGSTSGYAFGGVRNDTLAALAGTDNEMAPLQVNAVGALYVTGSMIHNGILSSYNFTMAGETKVIDGSALPNVTAEGRNARVAVSTSGIVYTCLTDDAGASDLGTTITTHLSEIEGAVETIEGAISGSEMQVDIVSSATLTVDGSGVTQPVSGTVTANLSSTDNTVLDNILTKNTEIDAVLDTIKVDTEAIETAVELLDNAISGSEMQVDVVAALPAGSNAIGKLAANSGVDIGDVDVTSTVHPAGNGTFNSYGRFIAATSPTALTDASNGVNATETAAKEVIIQADYDNSGYFMVGDSGAAVTTNGIRVNAGDTLILPVADIADIYIDASTGSQQVFVTVIK